MKVIHYVPSGPMQGLHKQHCIYGRGAKPDNVYTPLVYFQGAKPDNVYTPLVYFQGAKWIKDDACWEKIVSSIRLQLPNGFEVK